MALSSVADSLYKHRRWGLSFPITPSHLLIISTPDPPRWGRTAWPNEGPRIHSASWGTFAEDCSVTLLSLINLRVAIRRNGEMIIVAARLSRLPNACLTSVTPPARAARLNNKAVSANPSWFRAPRKNWYLFFSPPLLTGVRCHKAFLLSLALVWRFKAVGLRGHWAELPQCQRWSVGCFSSQEIYLAGGGGHSRRKAEKTKPVRGEISF